MLSGRREGSRDDMALGKQTEAFRKRKYKPLPVRECKTIDDLMDYDYTLGSIGSVLNSGRKGSNFEKK